MLFFSYFEMKIAVAIKFEYIYQEIPLKIGKLCKMKPKIEKEKENAQTYFCR